MKKVELAKRVADECGIPAAQAADEVNDVFAVMRKVILEGEDITIHGFGSFEVVTSAPHQIKINFGANKGESVMCEPKRYIRFKTSKALKDDMNS